MYVNKGKPIFGYKDTFNLDHTLRPIIGAALLKFLEVVKDRDYQGVPFEVISYLVDNSYVEYEDTRNSILSEEDLDLASDYWGDLIEEMIWAFTTEEPDIVEYNFTYVENEDHGDAVDGGELWSLSCTNEEEQTRYLYDVKEYNNRVQNGYTLFGKYLTSLWW